MKGLACPEGGIEANEGQGLSWRILDPDGGTPSISEISRWGIAIFGHVRWGGRRTKPSMCTLGGSIECTSWKVLKLVISCCDQRDPVVSGFDLDENLDIARRRAKPYTRTKIFDLFHDVTILSNVDWLIEANNADVS